MGQTSDETHPRNVATVFQRTTDGLTVAARLNGGSRVEDLIAGEFCRSALSRQKVS
jgi:hypothetical protein